ncbi:MAG TPA: hypothetical protein VFI53_04825 [Myxococcaceae bacterium]|nr:hypothetical protein [Myxococcaceae bacterium]
MSAHRVLGSALLAALTGCSAPAEICNGATGIQLGVTLTDGYVPYTVEGERGRSFLQVEGSCQFAYRSAYPLAPEMVGVLDPEAERNMSERLSFGRWPALAGHYASGISDGPVLVLDSAATPGVDISCDDCSGRASPIQDIAEAYPHVLADLGPIALEARGAVRYRVWGPVEDPGFPVVDVVDAGVTVNVTALAQPTEPGRDEVRVTTQDWEADGFRALRRAATMRGASSIAARDIEGHIYRVDFRTILPSEGRAPYLGGQ